MTTMTTIKPLPVLDCPCGISPEPHACTWATPRSVAPVVGRPLQTILTWQKRGVIPSVRGSDGRIRVCFCESLCKDRESLPKWAERAEAILGRPLVETRILN